MEATKILIADDHPVFLYGLKAVINSLNEFEVESVVSDGLSAYKLIKLNSPKIAILDIDMPGLNGIEVAKKIHNIGSETKVVILTMHKDESIFNIAFDAGAIGYVVKDNAATDIVDCIHAVNKGVEFVSPQINSFLRNRNSGSYANPIHLINELTDTEQKVLRLVANNKSSIEIAGELHVSSKTVQNHRFNICKKMKLEGVNSLLSYALLNKYIINLYLS